MSGLYFAQNAAYPTTASTAKMATGTSVKTLLQVACPSTQDIHVAEWGISFDGSAAATPIQCELIDTGTVGATSLTSLTPVQYSADSQMASLCVGGTSATGFNSGSSAEGTITAVRPGDIQNVSPTGAYLKQFPLGREFYVAAGHFLRIRVTAATSVSCYAYVVWME